MEHRALPSSFADIFLQKERDDFKWTTPYAKDYQVTLLSHGVDPRAYSRFKSLTPDIGRSKDGATVYKWEKWFGHPGNWTKENATWCMQFCVECALRVETGDWADERPIPYLELYRDEITPVGDVAVLWDGPRMKSAIRYGPRTVENIERKPVGEVRSGHAVTCHAIESVDEYMLRHAVHSSGAALPDLMWVDISEVRTRRVDYKKDSEQT